MTKSITSALTATIKAEKNRRAAELLVGRMHKIATLSGENQTTIHADDLREVLGYLSSVDGNLTVAEYHLHAVNSQS